MRKLRRLVVLPLMLAGCATMGPASEGTGPHEATVPYDEAARIGRLQVTPLAMVEDSRCPQRVACIWAGRVQLKVVLVEGGQRSEPVLMMNEPLMTSDGALTLIATHPYTFGKISAPQPSRDFPHPFGCPSFLHLGSSLDRFAWLWLDDCRRGLKSSR